ncbi:unnamed protein product, partial [Brachionus calyciflorus]
MSQQKNDFLYFNKDNLVKAFEIMKPKVFTTTVTEIPNFMVIFGKNGVGKSRLLKAIRQQIVNSQNSIFPELIVRKLDYGKEPDSYDPNSTNHPLVNQELIEKFFECSFEKWEDIKNNNGSKEINRVYKIYKDKITINKDLEKKPEHCYFIEFKKYFRRQILKKICFGCLEQLLMLNVTYDNDIDKINDAFEDKAFKEKYDLEFNYRIIKNNHNIVEKLELNELIEFEHKNDSKIRIKFSDLSPGEKLILHLYVIWKDRDNIKIDKNEISTNQILLLDEPDSHCEPNLVLKLVKFLKEFLVQELKIQVIMTCHNTTTLFCFKYDKSLFILNESNSEVKLEEKPDTVIRNELASNIYYEIDFLKLDFSQTYSLTKDYYQKCLGNSFEHLIKLMTKGEKDFNFSKRKEFIELLTNETITEKDIFFKDFSSQSNKKKILLEQIKLNTKNDSNENILYIYWPESRINEAWDFMIFYRNQLYLYQVTTEDKDLKDQFKKSENVFRRINENSDQNTFDIWIESKFFFIKYNNSSDQLILSNQNSSDQLDLSKIFSIEEIFEDFFLKPNVQKKNIDENVLKEEEKKNIDENVLKEEEKKNKEFTVNGKFLETNSNTQIEFDEEIKFFKFLDENLYAIIFSDNIIKILRHENEDFVLVHSLIGHKEKPIDVIFEKDKNMFKSFDNNNDYTWDFENNKKPIKWNKTKKKTNLKK